MSRGTVLVIGGGGTAGHVADWSARLRDAAAARGVRVEVADEPSNVTGLWGDVAPAATWPLDYRDVAAACRLARERRAATDLRAVVGFREFSLAATSAAAAEVGLPWNPSTAVARVRAKDRCREWLHAHGFAQPKVRVFDTADAAEAHLRGRTAPAVVKPTDSFGSRGVRLVSPGEDPAGPIQEAFGHSSRVLIEDVIDGVPYSAEGILLRGQPHVLAVTAKSVSDPPYYVTLSNSIPAPLSPAQLHTVHERIAAAVNCVGLTHSLFHVEFFWTAHGVVLGEMHGRPAGDWIHAMVAYRYPGVEPFGMVLDDVLGEPVSVPSEPDLSRAAATLAVLSPPGIVAGVSGVEAAQATPGCLAVDVLVTPGTRIGTVTDSFQRAALVVVAGQDVTEARDRAAEAASRLTVHISSSPRAAATRSTSP
ncbi:MAG TPA: ATP-grasp domain-containing protein [Pseudonocardiaceae bacterium]|nr:ATP-grasp domain-containing protein [Pseudonocardiaceae bacterium]